jgi:hypothetical protein
MSGYYTKSLADVDHRVHSVFSYFKVMKVYKRGGVCAVITCVFKKLTSELAVSDGFRSTTNNVVFVYIHQAYLEYVLSKSL